MVGTTTTDVESNRDLADHDYTKGYEAKEDLNTRLTPAEEDLIAQLTSALNEVPAQSIECVSTNGVTMSIDELASPTEDITNSEVLKDFLDFEKIASISVTKGNETCPRTQSHSTRAPSPISKEQILDFLQDKLTSSSPESLLGSESGYESITSPQSLESFDVLSPQSLQSDEFEDHSMDFDIDSFNELFPSLF